jgi:hypothetical protein
MIGMMLLYIFRIFRKIKSKLAIIIIINHIVKVSNYIKHFIDKLITKICHMLNIYSIRTVSVVDFFWQQFDNSDFSRYDMIVRYLVVEELNGDYNNAKNLYIDM